MKTLIFDIETVGEDWVSLDEVTKSSLTRWADRSAKNKDERKALQTDIESGLGFSPLTGFVVAIGIYDLERKAGVIYYTGNGSKEDDQVGEFTYKQRNEQQMLEEFWEGAKHYDTFVTFNGRGFDVPFLYHRSVANSIKPSQNLLEGRYPYQQKSCRHVDLQDELTFFGAMQRRPSLHLFCRAFGIESPKGEVGGDDVAELYYDGNLRAIAEYNAKDVVATTALYKKWLEYLNFSKGNKEEDFINY